jgi:predicted ATP-dependent protease
MSAVEFNKLQASWQIAHTNLEKNTTLLKRKYLKAFKNELEKKQASQVEEQQNRQTSNHPANKGKRGKKNRRLEWKTTSEAEEKLSLHFTSLSPILFYLAV